MVFTIIHSQMKIKTKTPHMPLSKSFTQDLSLYLIHSGIVKGHQVKIITAIAHDNESSEKEWLPGERTSQVNN